MNSLSLFDIKGYKQSWTKSRIIDWIIKERPEYIARKYGEYIECEISQDYESWAEAIRGVIK